MPFSPESERGLHFIAKSIGKEQTNKQIKQTENDDDDDDENDNPYDKYISFFYCLLFIFIVYFF